MTTYADRVKETTTTTGTGAVALLGAPSSFQTFAAAFADQTEVAYTIAGPSEWEVGTGVFTLAGTTLSRVTVTSSSNGGALVNFSAGAKDVFCTYPARRVTDWGKSVGFQMGLSSR